jgi:hypothetical protein
MQPADLMHAKVVSEQRGEGLTDHQTTAQGRVMQTSALNEIDDRPAQGPPGSGPHTYQASP